MTSTAAPRKTGVVLLNMGGPDSLSAVRPFLANLFSDKELIRLPAAFVTQPLFAWLVSGFRSRHVRGYYADIGGGSPIASITGAQAQALETALSGSVPGRTFKVYVGMRYWHPSTKHAVLRMKDDGITDVVALPLYPHYCAATTGSSVNDLKKWMRWAGLAVPLCEIRSYPDHAGYVAALAGKIQASTAGIPADGMHLLFSAHGVPKYFIDEGDSYENEIGRCVAAVGAWFPNLPRSISYQSRAGRAVWLGPDTVEETKRLAASGVKTLVVVPISFVSEHIETLHELDIRLKADALSAGIGRFIRVPTLNDDPPFIAALRDILLSGI
ncbi:MAG TPA: ferrochelatase [Candidatus Deferrimicrobiaceae bacterium]